ncbi:MAG: NAD(P)H-binding protein [Desulfomicrobium escambiense]|nr:NAD(P)H-binding protein [Desulfomicrobium escambiense]
MRDLHVIIGTGPVGRAVAEALAARGRKIRIISKTGRMPDPPVGAEVRAVEVLDRPALDSAVAGAAVVYQCAQPPYGRWAAEFPAFQRAVLEAAERAGARLVLAENLYGYGDRGGAPIRDDSPMAAADAKGRTRLAMSEEAFAAHEAGRLPVAAVRASDFFGPWAWEQSHLGARSLGPWPGARPPPSWDPRMSPTHSPTSGTSEPPSRSSGRRGKGTAGPGLRRTTGRFKPSGEALSPAAGLLGRPLRVKALGRPALTPASLFVPVVRELLPLLYQFEKPLRRGVRLLPAPLRDGTDSL